ncbi:MAG: hypothetical protein RL198_520 [Actinomycetota bacterium]|jgi:predicted branched-subunit amino acid permease
MSLSVGFATGLYGISFGAIAAAAGLTLVEIAALSLLMFSGASQFAFVGIVASGGGFGAAISSSWLLGVRNGFYALRLAPLIGPAGLHKLLAAQLTIDESNAVSAAQPNDRLGRLGFWLTGAAVFVFWNLMTIAGGLLGSQLGNPSDWGLDAAAAAAFLALLWPRLRPSRYRLLALFAGLATALLIPQLPLGVPILLAALLALLPAFWEKP